MDPDALRYMLPMKTLLALATAVNTRAGLQHLLGAMHMPPSSFLDISTLVECFLIRTLGKSLKRWEMFPHFSRTEV